MGADRIVAKSGRATVEIDQREVIALANRLTDGAVETFLKAAHRQMDPVVANARAELWPRRTGRSQGGTYIVDRLKPTEIEVVALNPVPYTYKLRFSVVTSGAIDREARQLAGHVWSRLASKVDRVNPSDRTRRGQYRGQAGARRRVASKFMAEASDGRWTKWWPKDGPSLDSLRRAHKADLIHRHGTGAPSEDVAGKHVWSYRVRTPVRRGEAALIAEAQHALERLAKG